MRYTEFKYMEQEDDCGTESHSNGSSSIREKRERGYRRLGMPESNVLKEGTS